MIPVWLQWSFVAVLYIVISSQLSGKARIRLALVVTGIIALKLIGNS